jgi:hypothetical protein
MMTMRPQHNTNRYALLKIYGTMRLWQRGMGVNEYTSKLPIGEHRRLTLASLKHSVHRAQEQLEHLPLDRMKLRFVQVEYDHWQSSCLTLRVAPPPPR